MTAYYNEIDPYAAQWLRNLISAGHIAAGDVDERSIVDVRPDDLKGYTQCHFFAGIGGWSIALRLAGWSDDEPVWTGSCPCQPFSSAGKQKAQQDERHLWPHWFGLIAAVRPGVVFGEQVAGAIAHGWLDDAFDDLEREGYETGAAVLPACSVGAPHKRDRLWFVGDSRGTESRRLPNIGGKEIPSIRGASEALADTATDATSTGLEGQRDLASGIGEKQHNAGYFSGWEFEPAVGRVANGIPARAHKLRAYGNAIVPQVAAEFIVAADQAMTNQIEDGKDG